jgi:predicted permease
MPAEPADNGGRHRGTGSASGPNLAIVAICSAVPTSPSAYVLARQMGGDAPLLAQIITSQTITMPLVA